MNRNSILKTPANIKTDYFNHYFIRGQNDMKDHRKKSCK